jgi:subtilisin family serine protease
LHISRIHGSARSNGVGKGNVGYDDVEEVIGLSRTFRVDFESSCHVSEVLDALRQAQAVESASACYLCATEPDGVEQIEPDTESAWLPRDAVNLSEALAMEQGDPAVTVAVVDTGVVPNHPELWGQVARGFDTVQLSTRDLGSGIELIGDIMDPDRAPDDEVGHGTSCAGIIAAKGDRIPPGVGGACTIVPFRVLGSARVPGKDHLIGLGRITDIDDGVKKAIDSRVNVINMSLGTPIASVMKDDPTPHEDVVAYGLARGCIFVAASGNSPDEYYTPACLPGVITVGSVGADGRPSAFTAGGFHVDLCAPGENIDSTGLKGYSRQKGTSFAAPFVAGAAALLVSRALRHSLILDASDVRRLLVESARANSSFDTSKYGSGILDVSAALQALDRWATRQQQREYEALVV